VSVSEKLTVAILRMDLEGTGACYSRLGSTKLFKFRIATVILSTVCGPGWGGGGFVFPPPEKHL